MSERDLHRIGVLSEVVSGRGSIASAASLLAVSSRHIHRLLGRLEAGGGVALAQRARGRPPSNKIQVGIQGYAVALVREKYADFGPTLVAEVLAQHHALTVSRETLCK